MLRVIETRQHMNRRTHLVVQTRLTLLATLGPAWGSPPDDFPRFQVPGHEKEMATVRELFWLHYPGAGPKAMRQAWAGTLSARILDPEGYMAPRPLACARRENISVCPSSTGSSSSSLTVCGRR